MPELHRDLGLGLTVHEVHDPLPGGRMLGSIEARTARRDAGPGAHVGHLGKQEAPPAHGAPAGDPPPASIPLPVPAPVTSTPACRAAFSANHASTLATKSGSRTLRF